MLTYRFDENTKEFLVSEQAFLDPLESQIQNKEIYLLPANSTFTKPLDPKEGYAVVWENNEWIYKEDHRQKRDKGSVIIETSGTPYWLAGDTYLTPARYMKELGELPEGAILVKPEKPLEVIEKENEDKAKLERAQEVKSIIVEVDGLMFDGDEISQDRMSRTITAAKTLNLPEETTIEWTLADNSAAQVTVQQLAQALYLAGQKQTSIWRTPYNN